MRTTHLLSFVLLLAVCFAQPVMADEVVKTTIKGTPELRSIQVLSFGPDGWLFVGDGAGRQVIAIQTGDTTPQAGLQKPITDIQQQIAGRIGGMAKSTEIIDLAVNPVSHVAYLAVRRKNDKQHLILTVNSQGEIGGFGLTDVTYAQLPLPETKAPITRITDLAWAEDRLLISGRANEEFASKILVASAPLEHKSQGVVYSAETYHVSHRRWETKAPMSVLVPYLDEGGQMYVVGAFSCTPIVRYPIASLEPGAKVKGESVLELGSGNRPIDMFTYEKGGKHYVLANTFRFHHEKRPISPGPYWTVRFDRDILGEDEKLNEQALRRVTGKLKPATDRVSMVETFHGVVQMDLLDAKRALVLRLNKGEQLSLEPVELP